MKNLFLVLVMTTLFIPGCGSGGGSSSAPTSQTTATNQYAASFKGVYPASSQSDVYHYPSCPSALQISSSNLLTFDSADLAVTKGYRPCLICTPPQGVATNYPPILIISNVHPLVVFRSATSGYSTINWIADTSDLNGNLKEISCKVFSPLNEWIDSCTTLSLTSIANASYTITMSKNIQTRLTDLTGTYTIETIVTDLGGLSASHKDYITLN